jgi:hypothetical protein
MGGVDAGWAGGREGSRVFEGRNGQGGATYDVLRRLGFVCSAVELLRTQWLGYQLSIWLCSTSWHGSG